MPIRTWFPRREVEPAAPMRADAARQLAATNKAQVAKRAADHQQETALEVQRVLADIKKVASSGKHAVVVHDVIRPEQVYSALRGLGYRVLQAGSSVYIDW